MFDKHNLQHMLVKESKDIRKTSIALYPILRAELNSVLDKNGNIIEKYPKPEKTAQLEDVD
jgi:hypothetical protein